MLRRRRIRLRIRLSRSLIGGSVDKVESGSRLVAEAGQTMVEIVNSVQRVTDIVAEISAAANEQSGGIAQVNDAVAGLDQATQQNAEMWRKLPQPPRACVIRPAG